MVVVSSKKRNVEEDLELTWRTGGKQAASVTMRYGWHTAALVHTVTM
jgi:hypothetical protein